MSHTVVLTCTPSAGIERIWRALTTTAGLAEWLWPQWDDVEYRFEPRVGADYAIRSEREGRGAHGRVTAVDAPHRLAFTWIWDSTAASRSTEGDAPDDVQFELTPADYQTLVTLTLSITRPEDEANQVQGWSDALQRLEKVR